MRRLARSLSVAFVLVGAGAARADSVSAYIAPGVSTSHTTHTDEAGHTTSQDFTDITQQYRLSLDERPWSNVGFTGTGAFAKELTLTRDATGTTQTNATLAALSTRLGIGTGLLGGALSYDRRQDQVNAGSPWATAETVGMTMGWHPVDLPTLDLRLSRSDVHDPSSTNRDTVTYDGLLGVGYTGFRNLDLRYSLRLSDVSTPGFETTSVTQDARASYHDTLFDGRTNAYGTVGISSMWSATQSLSASATVPTQRFPIAGLSVIEDFPALPENVLLSPNRGLVDGDLRSSAAVNLGFSVGTSDRRPRDLGVQLPDVVTKVSRILVWVDRPLPALVSGAFLWDAYQSDDGQHWTQIPLAGPARFGTVENRFEIPIVETAARYLKVVTHAIDTSVTTDARWSDIWVTEVQLFDDVPASELHRDPARIVETFSGTAQTRILSSPNLSHDISVNVTHPTDGTPTTWMLVNGLSLTHPASRTLTLSGRVAEQESDSGIGHTSALQWSGTAAHQPFATIADGFNYSGQVTRLRDRTDFLNSAAAYGRAQIYTGVAATGNAIASVTTSSTGSVSRTTGGTIGAAVTPNRMTSVSGTYGVSTTQSSGGGQPSSNSTRQQADATATFTPVPAVYASVGVSRVLGIGRPTTLGHFGLTLSPFPDGAVLFRFLYSDAIDTAADSRAQTLGPTLRWAFSPHAYLDLAYTDIRATAPVEKTRTQTASANLTITL